MPLMVCFYPMTGWRSSTAGPSGAHPIVFDKKEGIGDPITISCGYCIGCRLERSKQWAIRCMHEAQLHKDNCFITLTYDDEHLPTNHGLDPDHFTKFMKRLRKHLGNTRIRYFHCGEYGSLNGRAHHHAIIFGWNPPDRIHWKTTNGQRLFISDTLNRIWGYGFTSVGAATWESAAYVARYIMKKANGDAFEDRYVQDKETGEMIWPEYVTMSRRPGIAADWIFKYKSDVYTTDSVLIRDGVKARPPKYYDKIFDQDPDQLKKLKKNRILKRKEVAADNTWQRLETKKEVLLSKISLLKREL